MGMEINKPLIRERELSFGNEKELEVEIFIFFFDLIVFLHVSYFAVRPTAFIQFVLLGKPVDWSYLSNYQTWIPRFAKIALSKSEIQRLH